MPRTLLVVDDAIIIREIIKDTATAAGWEIVGEGRNGQEAIDLYQQLRPDAVTLDLVMPEFDGLHALRGMLACDAQAKVVIVSALEQTTILKDAFRLGAADFLVKPFDRELLVKTLDKLAPAEPVSA